MIRSLCLSGAALVAFSGVVRADEIHLLKGKPLLDVTVRDETYEVVIYKPARIRTNQEVDAAKVKEVIYDSSSDSYSLAEQKMAQGDLKGAFQSYMAAAGSPPKQKAWIKQYGLFNAAECLRLQRDFDGAIKAYEKLVEEVPKTKFYGDAFLRKSACYEAKKDAANAKKALEELRAAADAGVGERWGLMADYHLIRMSGSGTANFDKYVALQSRASGAGYADVANLARLGVGYALIEQSKLDEAKNYFQDIIDDRQASPTPVVAGAYNGLGTCIVSADSPKPEDWNKALFSFLKTVFHYGDELGQSDLVAEALFWAGRCFEERGGDESTNTQRSRFMYTRCVKEFPTSKWAVKASER